MTGLLTAIWLCEKDPENYNDSEVIYIEKGYSLSLLFFLFGGYVKSHY
jgi:hypothetical protein